MDKVAFVNTDPATVLANLVTDYESLAGKKLQPAQAEQLVLQAVAYRFALLLNGVNETANQNMVAFASGPALDLLGELVGVVRLTAAPATCIIRFTLVVGHGSLNIPDGIRVQSTDGQLTFLTTETKTVAADTNTVDITAECTTTGVAGNDYSPGEISVILDPQPYVSSAANTDATAGGSDAETDDKMRERIRLAPSSFSVAGPDDAYRYHALGAHPLIIDVAITSPNPGDVYIYPLLDGGITPPQEIIDAVNEACNSKKVRPLTDSVYVETPTKVQYVISIEITLLTTAVQSQVASVINANLTTYKNVRKTKLGLDVVRSQLAALAQVAGVYKVNVVSPSADIVTAENEFTEATATTVSFVGVHDE